MLSFIFESILTIFWIGFAVGLTLIISLVGFFGFFVGVELVKKAWKRLKEGK